MTMHHLITTTVALLPIKFSSPSLIIADLTELSGQASEVVAKVLRPTVAYSVDAEFSITGERFTFCLAELQFIRTSSYADSTVPRK